MEWELKSDHILLNEWKSMKYQHFCMSGMSDKLLDLIIYDKTDVSFKRENFKNVIDVVYSTIPKGKNKEIL